MYKLIQFEADTEFFEKKSRFLGLSRKISSSEDFQAQFASLKQLHPKANHITFAYRIKDTATNNIKTRFSDDGEPSGTAGKPILAHLEGQDLINTVIFVIRYFGGVKLGTGGLVRAYSHSAGLTLEASGRCEYIDHKSFAFSLPYGKQRLLEYHLKNMSFESVSIDYGETIDVEISCTEELIGELKKNLGI